MVELVSYVLYICTEMYFLKYLHNISIKYNLKLGNNNGL